MGKTFSRTPHLNGKKLGAVVHTCYPKDNGTHETRRRKKVQGEEEEEEKGLELKW
jgi:hypothetical protein